MSGIPSAKVFDSTLALLRNPYGFIPDYRGHLWESAESYAKLTAAVRATPWNRGRNT